MWGTILGKPKKPPSFGKQATPTHSPCSLGARVRVESQPRNQKFSHWRKADPPLPCSAGSPGLGNGGLAFLAFSLLLVPGLFFIPLGDRQMFI